MKNNGKDSSSKRTKYINIRYYFVTDLIEKYELSLDWCPKIDMIGYLITKTTQYEVFKRFQYQIMGVTEDQDPGLVNPEKYPEYQVCKDGQKAARNAAPAPRSVLEYMFWNKHAK